MPIDDMHGTDAARLLETNPAARWCSGWEVEPGPGTAWNRLNKPFFEPHINPEFVITPDDRLFAIGSCFARGVEGALAARGFTVESITTEFDHFNVAAKASTPLGFTNRYTPESIANQLEWALDPRAEFPVDALVKAREGEWFDPHSTPVFGRGDWETTLEQRRLLTQLTRRVARCRVVVVTLGLIETWYDTVTGLYTNTTPPLVPKFLDRFRFHVLEYRQVIDALGRIHGLIADHGHPDAQIVVTVSPVPLMATFTGKDVVTANTYSKSVLRAAAEEWTSRHQNVHYFPSYEIVVNADRGLAWEHDGRHVRTELVRHIMGTFASRYLGSDAHALVATRTD